MWAIKFLTGKLAGQIIPIKQGSNIIGRGNDCDIVVPTKRVSKAHAKIDVNGNDIELSDLGSTNGTFVNGIAIKRKKISYEDKLLINDIVFCLVSSEVDSSNVEGGFPAVMGGYENSGSLDGGVDEESRESKKNIIEKANEFIESSVLPGVYSLYQSMDLKWAIGIIMAVTTFATCIFSYIPAIGLMNERIRIENTSKARSIARSLAEANREYVLKNLFNSVNTAVLGKTGAKKLYVLSEDKSIISPAILNGQLPKESFIFSEQSSEGYTTFQRDWVGSIVPIKFRSNRTGEPIVKGYAVAIFETKYMSIIHPRVLGRFVQSIFLVLFVFGLGVFFIYRMVNFPIETLNKKLDVAFRSGEKSIGELPFKQGNLSLLVSNINSAMNLSHEGDMGAPEGHDHNRSAEALNIAQMVGFPCLAVNAESQSVIFCNSAFEEKTGLSGESLEHSPLSEINDQALRLSIENLMERAALEPEQMHTNQLEIAGGNSEVAIQAVYGASDLAYFIITIIPVEEEVYDE